MTLCAVVPVLRLFLTKNMFSCERPLAEWSLFTSMKVFGLLYTKNIVLHKIPGSRGVGEQRKTKDRDFACMKMGREPEPLGNVCYADNDFIQVVLKIACSKLGDVLKEG